MSALNRGVLRGIETMYSDAFDNAMDEAQAPALQQLGLVDTISGFNGKQLNVTWMRRYSVMRQWVGERDFDNSRRFFEMIMFNEEYENAISIDVNDIEDEVVTEPRAENDMMDMVESYEVLQQHQLNDRLVNAFNTTHIGGSITGPYGQTIYQGSIDGKPLIATDHPYYEQIDFDSSRPAGEQLRLTQGGTESNYTDAIFDEDELWTARQAMREFKDFQGRPAPSFPDTLIVSPKNERKARQILNRQLKNDSGAAVDNETQGLYNLYVDEWLAGADDEDKWFLVDTTSRRKPFLKWERVPLQRQRAFGGGNLDSNVASGDVSWNIFKEGAVHLGVRARHGYAYGAWNKIYGSDGTGA